MAEHREIVCAAQTRGAGADDGDLMAVIEELLRHEARLRLQLLPGDELLHLVDRDGLIHVAAGADLLAEAGAHIAADGGEGVLLLDELERLEILALAGLFQIALHGDVRGAVGLAGGGAGLGHDVLAVGEKVRLPVLLAEEDLVVRDDRLRDLHGVLLAELLAELHRVLRADLHAAAAGDALFRLDCGEIVRPREAGRLGVPARLQRHAGVPLAVADEEGEVLAVDVRELMHSAPALGLEDDLLGLLPRDAPRLARADAALGVLAEIDAAVKFQIRRALADHAAQLAAFARGDADALPGLVQPVGDLLVLHALRFALDRLLHRDRAHERLSHRHGPGDQLLQVQHVVQKRRRRLGEGVRALLRHDGALHAARREDGQLHAVDAALVAVIFQQADVHEIVGHLCRVLDAHALARGELVDVIRFAQLHLQREVHLRVGQLPVEEDVFPALLARQGVEHVDVAHELDQVLARRFAALPPVRLQTFFLAFRENMVCHKSPSR